MPLLRFTMEIIREIVGQLEVNCYIVYDKSSLKAMIVDPGDEPEKISALIDDFRLAPRYIVFTHAHYDHVCAAVDLKKKYNASIAMHTDEKSVYEMTKNRCVSWGYETDDFPVPDLGLKDGDIIRIGSLGFEIIHTPGHTPGSICIYGEKTVFTGDTLFRGSVGRTDLPGGNTEKLLASLNRLMLLPPETRVLCGHGEESTVDRESRTNPYINSKFKLKFFS